MSLKEKDLNLPERQKRAEPSRATVVPQVCEAAARATGAVSPAACPGLPAASEPFCLAWPEWSPVARMTQISRLRIVPAGVNGRSPGVLCLSLSVFVCGNKRFLLSLTSAVIGRFYPAARLTWF